MQTQNKSKVDLQQKFAKGSTAMVLSRVINQFIGLGVVWAQTEYLSVWGYGVFELFLGTMIIINTLGNIGVADIAKRFLPEFSEKEKDEFIAITLRIVVIIRFIACAVLLLLAYLFYDTVGPFFNIGDYRDLFGLFAIGALFATETFLLKYCYSALFRQVRYVISFTFYNLFRLVAFYFVLKSGNGLTAAIAIDGISHLLLFLGLYLPMSSEYKAEDFGNYRQMPVKRMARYGFFMYLNNLGNVLFNMTTDKWVISAMLDKFALGYYSFAVKLGYAAYQWMPHTLIGSVLEPYVYRNYVRDNQKEAIVEKFAKIVTLEAFFLVPATVFFLTFSSPVIEYIFDPKFLPSASILGGLSIVFMVVSMRFPLSIVATAMEKVKLLFIFQTVFAVYNLVADIILVKYIGLWGAVIATGTASAFLVISLWITISKFAPLRVEVYSLLRIFANAFLMGLYFWFANSHVNSFFWVVATFLGGGAFYLVLSYFNPPYEREEIARIWRTISNSVKNKSGEDSDINRD